MKKLSMFLSFLLLITFSTGCEIIEDLQPKQYFLKFKVDGVEHSYYSDEGWGFNNDDENFIGFWDDENDDDNYIMIRIPTDVTNDSTYSQATTNFEFTISIGTDDYSSTYDDSTFELNVTEWGSIGSVVSGTFSGTLKKFDGTTSKIITNGTFEATNNTDESWK